MHVSILMLIVLGNSILYFNAHLDIENQTIYLLISKARY